MQSISKVLMQGLFGRNLNRICRKIFSEGPAQVMQGHTEDFRPRSSHKGLYKIMQGSMPLSSCRLVKTSPSSIAAVDLKHHFCPRPLEGHEKPTPGPEDHQHCHCLGASRNHIYRVQDILRMAEVRPQRMQKK